MCREGGVHALYIGRSGGSEVGLTNRSCKFIGFQ